MPVLRGKYSSQLENYQSDSWLVFVPQLEEMKGKDRVIAQMQRECHLLATRIRLSPSPSPHRSRGASETSGPAAARERVSAC